MKINRERLRASVQGRIWRESAANGNGWLAFKTRDIKVVSRPSAVKWWPDGAESQDWCLVFLVAKDDTYGCEEKRTFFIHGKGDPRDSDRARDVHLTLYVGGTPGQKDGTEKNLPCSSPEEAVVRLCHEARKGFGLPLEKKAVPVSRKGTMRGLITPDELAQAYGFKDSAHLERVDRETDGDWTDWPGYRHMGL